MKKKVLWIGDAVVQTGFSRVTHNVLGRFNPEEWDVHILGVNYNGDPHRYPYAIYPASLGGDVFGIGRVRNLITRIQPDVIVINNDPWIVAPYLDEIIPPKTRVPPVVAYMPVDAPNQMAGRSLNRLAKAVTYTQFGRKELLLGGYRGPCDIVPHGVDTEMYFPEDRKAAREHLQFTDNMPEDAFIVGNVNRNQPRKRLDLTMQYWTQWWINAGQPAHAYLYLHTANHDIGWNVLQLARYFGIEKNFIMTNPKMSPSNSLPESDMRFVYSAFDVQITTTLGEGWGLTNHEGMACGVPQIMPDYSALGEWAREGALMVPVSSYHVTPQAINTIGGCASQDDMIAAIDQVYKSRELRKDLSERAFAVATRPEFAWDHVANRFDEILSGVILDWRMQDEAPAGISREAK